MSDIFNNDTDDALDLSKLEDNDYTREEPTIDENYVYPDPLYLTKLEYSSEGVYCTVPKNFPELNPGDKVITSDLLKLRSGMSVNPQIIKQEANSTTAQ